MDTFQYVGRFNTLRSSFGGLPAPARFVVGVMSIPGIVLGLLSIVLFVVSILVLLLLTVPVYRLLQLVCFSRPCGQDEVSVTTVQDVASSGRRQVDAKVIE
jgi:hypothetical protein